MTDETAQAILALPDDGKFVHRGIIWQGDWTNTDIATYAELKRMAKFWLMRSRIIQELEWYRDDTPITKSEIELRDFVRQLKALEAEC